MHACIGRDPHVLQESCVSGAQRRLLPHRPRPVGSDRTHPSAVRQAVRHVPGVTSSDGWMDDDEEEEDGGEEDGEDGEEEDGEDGEEEDASK